MYHLLHVNFTPCGGSTWFTTTHCGGTDWMVPKGYCMSTTLLQNYREFMRGVDKGNQLQTYYNAGKRSRKWWKQVSFTSWKLLS